MLPSLAKLSLVSIPDQLIVNRGELVTQDELKKHFEKAEVDKHAKGASGEVRKIMGFLDGQEVWLAIKKQFTDQEAANEIAQHAAVYASLNKTLCASLFTEPLKVEPAAERSPWVYSLQKWACAENTTVMMLSEEFRSNKKRPPQQLNLKLIGDALKQLGRAWACLHATGYVHADSHASNVMLCLVGKELQGVKLIDMGRVRTRREGEGFEFEWNEMNKSIVRGLTWSTRANMKFETWERDTFSEYEEKLKELRAVVV